MRAHPTVVLAVLLVAAVVAMLPNSVLFPATHDIALHLHQSESFVGFMVTWYSVAYVAATPVLGIWSDHVGRKLVIVVGLLLFAVGGLVPLLTQAPDVILGGRAVMGVGAAGVLPMVDSTIGDMYAAGPKRRAALAAFGGAIAVAEAVLPFLSGVMDSLSWRFVFLLYGTGVVSAVACAWIAWPKSEGEAGSAEQQHLHGYWRALRVASTMPILLGALVCTVLFGVVYFGVSALLPLSVNNGANGLLNGLLFLPLGVSWVASSAWFARRPQLLHVHRATLIGSFILAFGTLWLGFTHKVPLLLIISLIWGLGSGVQTTLFSWVVGDEAPPRVRGAINALYNAAYVLGFAVGAPLFMYLKEVWSYQWSATTASFVMILSGFIGFVLLRPGNSRDVTLP